MLRAHAFLLLEVRGYSGPGGLKISPVMLDTVAPTRDIQGGPHKPGELMIFPKGCLEQGCCQLIILSGKLANIHLGTPET